MSNLSTGTDAAPAPMSLLSRVVGIITSPKATFESVVAHPKWLAMFALTMGITLASTTGPMFTEWGQQALLDQQVAFMEGFGMTVTDEAYARMQEQNSRAPYWNAIGGLVGGTIMLMVISGILYGIFNALLGGNATFKQQIAVVVHAGIIPTLGALFALPINYARGSFSSATNLSVLVPMLDENSFLATLLGMIDVFWVWYFFVLAIGLAVLYRRRTQPIATTLFAIYGVIALGVALVKGLVGGSN